jgi:hypothetical protein
MTRPTRHDLGDLSAVLADDWRESAACATHGHPDWWNDDAGGDPELVEAARHVCRGCSVRNACLVDAIRGAFTADERRGLDLTDLEVVA